MTQPAVRLDKLGHEGADAFAKVSHHLKDVTAQLAEQGGDAMSASAVALGHAAVDLVGELQTRLDALRDEARREVRRHPVESLASASIAAALAAAAVASLATYALTRRQS
ncbi:hypothetical protein [Caulobacter sp. 1776]|uniref:hypothetical protein n=1 Tax=Caulobacter sp. 1776 TaxID=3156420 RepID=UPI0033921BBA